MTKSPGKEAKQEFAHIIIISCALVGVQILFSALGLGGMAFATTLYAVTTIGSNMFSVDFSGIKPARRGSISVMGFLARTGVNVALMLSGLILWFLVGLLYGLDTAIMSVKSPDEILNRMVGGNFFNKIILAVISHVTLFSFCRFCANIFGMFQAMLGGVWGGDDNQRRR